MERDVEIILQVLHYLHNIIIIYIVNASVLWREGPRKHACLVQNPSCFKIFFQLLYKKVAKFPSFY